MNAADRTPVGHRAGWRAAPIVTANGSSIPTRIRYDAIVADGPNADEPRRPLAELQAFAAVRASLLGRLGGGMRVGRYVLGRRLGRGAMGVVYMARDRVLSRDVAIKLVRSDDPQLHAALLTEARALASFSHPNVLTVLDVGTHGRDIYVVTEMIDGCDLRKWVRVQPRDHFDVLDVLRAAGAGLAAAHEHGLVHRDIKPDNLLIGGDGRVRVADFGLAKRSGANSTPQSGQGSGLTTVDESADTAGTPAYMAPEQHRGEATAASDQFALCVTAIEALGGVAVFDGDSMEALYAAKLRPVTRPAAIPRRWWVVLRRGLAVDPRQRWPNVCALLDRLERVRRRRVAVVATVATTVMVAALGWWQAPVGVEACAEPEARLAKVWSPGHASALREVFEATGSAHAHDVAQVVEAELESFAAQWSGTYREACAAADSRDDDARWCAERRLTRVGALLDVLGRASAAELLRAPAAIREVVRDDNCGPIELAFARHDDDPRVQALLADFDRVAAMHGAARLGEAERLSRESLARATEVGYPELVARAAFNLGIAHSNQQHFVEAESAHTDAFHLLTPGRDDRLAVLAALGVAVAVAKQGRPDAARRWIRHASGTAAAAGLGDLEADIAHADGITATLAGEYEPAIRRLAEAVALRELQADPLRICDARHELSTARVSAAIYGQHDKTAAERELRVALSTCVGALGRHHPDIGALHDKLGVLLTQGGRWAEAVAEHDLALAIYDVSDPLLVRARGDILLNRGLALGSAGEHENAVASIQSAIDLYRLGDVGIRDLDIGRGLLDLAVALRAADRRDEALVAANTGLDALQVVLPEGHPMLAVATSNVAELLGELARDEDAVRWGERAIAAVASSLGDGHVAMAMARANLGRVEARRGHLDRAITLLDEALRVEPDGVDGMTVTSDAAFDLARLLGPTDPERAIALLARARDAAQQLPPGPAQHERLVEIASALALGCRTRERSAACATMADQGWQPTQ